MRDKLDRFDKAGTRILVIDPHERYRSRHFTKRAGEDPLKPHVPVLADPAHVVSATYGVAFQMKIHTEHSNRPATFLVDREGILRFAHRGEKYSDRPKPSKILAEIEKLREE